MPTCADFNLPVSPGEPEVSVGVAVEDLLLVLVLDVSPHTVLDPGGGASIYVQAHFIRLHK